MKNWAIYASALVFAAMSATSPAMDGASLKSDFAKWYQGVRFFFNGAL